MTTERRHGEDGFGEVTLWHPGLARELTEILALGRAVPA